MIHNTPLFDCWESVLQSKIGTDLRLQDVHIVAGGSINEARKLVTNRGCFFVKLNHVSVGAELFEREASGLTFLRVHSSFEIPSPIAVGQFDAYQWLIMDFIEGGLRSRDFWQKFGLRLAEMHKSSNEKFGFEQDNYLGTLHQQNVCHEDWPAFFQQERLMPQVSLAERSGRCDSRMRQSFERLYSKIESIFPAEPPAAIHGDLWSGNFMTNQHGEAVIFDPAVYFGHREMDIGMTKLFGGFDDSFYEAYNETYPLESGWQERIEIANLYPLMAHVNLFGGSYVAQVHRTLRKYT